MATLDKIIDLLAIQKNADKLSQMEKEDMLNWLHDLENVYPFSDYEFVISHLLGLGKMDLSEYEQMREVYLQKNYYLHTFEMAGKSVWIWAEQLLIWGWHGLKKPSKKIDPNYSQQTSYDAYLEYDNKKIRIEIKASRVTEAWNDEDIFIEKALFSNTDRPFWMNFQQLKPQYSDVFIFVAIYRDKIKYWILSSDEVRNYWSDEGHTWKFSKWQHSGNSWNEWQLHIRDTNIHDFDRYLVEPENIRENIISTFYRQNSL